MNNKTMTVAFRTTPEIKNKAEALFNSLGMSLSSAIDMFLHQAVKENRYPCLLDSKIVSSKIQDMSSTYPASFFFARCCSRFRNRRTRRTQFQS